MAVVKRVSVIVVLVVLVAGWAPRILSEELKISVPAMSDTGAFIVKLIPDENLEPDFDKEVELYRNRDGGQYSLITSGPLFKAVSQLVNHNGVYGYKVRWKSAGQQDAESFSDEAFVTVNARVTKEDFVRTNESRPEEIKVVSNKQM